LGRACCVLRQQLFCAAVRFIVLSVKVECCVGELANVIEEAKRTYYKKTTSKFKATWDIIKELTNNQHSRHEI